eukprot:2260660-Rhodomonas_salina.2
MLHHGHRTSLTPEAPPAGVDRPATTECAPDPSHLALQRVWSFAAHSTVDFGVLVLLSCCVVALLVVLEDQNVLCWGWVCARACVGFPCSAARKPSAGTGTRAEGFAVQQFWVNCVGMQGSSDELLGAGLIWGWVSVRREKDKEAGSKKVLSAKEK